MAWRNDDWLRANLLTKTGLWLASKWTSRNLPFVKGWFRGATEIGDDPFRQFNFENCGPSRLAGRIGLVADSVSIGVGELQKVTYSNVEISTQDFQSIEVDAHGRLLVQQCDSV